MRRSSKYITGRLNQMDSIMKFLRTILIWVVVATMLILAAGCDEPSDDNADMGNKPPSECKIITICFNSDYTMSGQPKNIKGIKEMLEALNERTAAELNTRVEFIWPFYNDNNTEAIYSRSYEDDLTKILESNDAPDAFMVYGSLKDKFCEQELMKDITDLIPSCLGGYFSMLLATWGDEDELSDIYEYDGRIYAIPCNTVYSNGYCVIARQDLVDKYMTDGIEDLDDYCAFLEAVKKNESDDISPGFFYGNDLVGAYIMENGYFCINDIAYVYMKCDDDAANPLFMHQTDAYPAGYDLFMDMIKRGVLFRGINKEEPIKEGTLASIFCKMLTVRFRYSDFTSKFQYRMYPLYPEDSILKKGHSSHALGINPDSANADRVLMFINWLQANQENYDLVMYGIKDKHYRLNGNRLDFTGIEGDSNPGIVGWCGSEVFRNYAYERPTFFEPENYAEFRMECVHRNAMTYTEFLESKGYDKKLIQEHKYDGLQGYKDIEPRLWNIANMYCNFFIGLGEGFTEYTLDRTIDALDRNFNIDLQEDMDMVMDYYRSELLMYKQ